MQNNDTPAEGNDSAQLEAESALRGAPCSVFLVICATDYEGDNVEAVYLDRDSAIRHRDNLNLSRYTVQNYRAEEWKDGFTEGNEI